MDKTSRFPLLAAAIALSVGTTTSFAQTTDHPASSAPSMMTSAIAALPSVALRHNAAQPQKITIGERVLSDKKLMANHARATLTGEQLLSQTVQHLGAQYVKLHFSQVQWPAGAVLVVRNPDNTERYQYRADDLRQATFQAELGDNGNQQFSAMSISGDTAIVEWHWPSQTNAQLLMTATPVAVIDSYFVGKQDPTAELTTFSTCGANERRDVQCWANSHPTEFERTRPVARLLIGGSSLCTGWRVSSDNRIFTNNHCVETNSEATSTEFWFNYQNTSCGGNTRETIVKVTGASLLKTDYTLDYSLITVNNFANISQFGYFGLDVREATQGERIYIPQHGAGNPKELAIESDQDSNGLCQVNQASTSGRGSNTDIGYYCDTIGGSSGSPVLAAASNKVIALHHLGGCTNTGAKVALIWPQVANFFNDQIPDGDNQPSTHPTARFTAQCTGFTCQFDGSGSSAGNGNVTQWQWQFGDGQTGNGGQVDHLFATTGEYQVTLTVTNSQGQTASTSQSVTVSDEVDPRQLNSGEARTGLAGAKSSEQLFFIDASNGVTVNISGGSGDADLYVQKDAAPTTQIFDCRPYKSANNESCTLNSGAGRYWIMLRGYRAYSGVTLIATSN